MNLLINDFRPIKQPMTRTRCTRRALTLIELIVVIAIITLLIGIMIPGLARSRRLAKQTTCLTGLQQIGVAITTYAFENRSNIPYGPTAPPPSATNFYPLTGNVTSLISLESGAPVGLGLLLADHLGKNKEVLFCPGTDESFDIQQSLANVGISQVESSYYYRHASVAMLSGPLPPPQINLDQLGKNRNGAAVRSLVTDTQFVAPPKMALFNLNTRTHHQQKVSNALFADGHATTHQNTNKRFLVNVSLSVYETLDRILDNFETLDKE